MKNYLQQLSRDIRGNTLIVFSATLPLMIGAAALATDTIQWTLAKRQLQRAADSAAIAGVYARIQDQTVASAVSRDLVNNNHVGRPLNGGYPAISYPAATTSYKLPVKVALEVTVSSGLFSMFMARAPRVRAEATAAVVTVDDFCMISLETDPVSGISAGGSAAIDLNCGAAANSPSPLSVSAFGSTSFSAKPISSFGGISPNGNFNGSEIRPYSPLVVDPFAHITPVKPAGPCANDPKGGAGQTISLSPGCYKGLTMQGNVTLQPGIYYIDGGDARIAGSSVVVAREVTIVLTNSSSAGKIGQFDVSSSASLTMTPPTTGTFAGISVFQDRRAPNTKGNKIGGSAALDLAGAFYFPNQELEFGGSSALTLDCIQMVARRISFQGSMTMRNNCASYGGVKPFAGTQIRLVG